MSIESRLDRANTVNILSSPACQRVVIAVPSVGMSQMRVKGFARCSRALYKMAA